MIDFVWFNKEMTSYLKGYEVKYKYFEEGDFGSLNQVEFNSKKRGGEVDFWSTGWLRIHLVDYVNGNELMNIFLEPNQKEEKEKAFNKLSHFLIEQ